MAEVDMQNLTGVAGESYGADHANHLLEQYKLSVEMADKISERRQTANTYFLTVNTALVTLMGLAWPGAAQWCSRAWFCVVGVAGLALCYSWYRLIRSYKEINDIKFEVIEKMEDRLPLRPYFAEWEAAEHGKNPEVYKPFTHVEIGVPWVFFALYLTIIGLGIAAWVVELRSAAGS